MADERFGTLVKATRAFMNLPLTRQLILLATLAVSIALGYSVINWLADASYRPLFSNLDNKDLAAVADILQKNHIDYKISDRDGSILVPVNKEKEAKLKLMASGYLENNSFSFDKLDKESSLGSSRFLENIRYNRALEGELSRTIMAIKGIRGARVHLALPKPSVFVGQEEHPTASVFIELSPGFELDKSQVNAIVQLVSGSIIGLKPGDVTVTDQLGRLLTEKNNSELALSEEQLTYQKEIQEYYEKRIQSMIAPLMGVDKVQVRVFANIDFTREEKTQEQFNPNDKALRSEQTLTEQAGGGGGSQGAPGAASNQPSETGGAAAASSSTGSNNSSKNQSTKNYEVSKVMSYTKTSMGKLVNLSVAVVVDNETSTNSETKDTRSSPVSKDKIQKINDLVRAAIGFDEKRGDKVSVINTPFVPPMKIEAPPAIPFYEQPWFWSLIEKGGAILITLFIALGVVRPFLKYLIGAKETMSAVEEDQNGERIILSPEMQQLKQQQLESLKSLANKEPTKVAGVLKNWVGSE